jgi:sRNA-binding regulator protein Hfq
MVLLKPNGILSLAIPDKRGCFDYFKPLSNIAEVINCYLNKDKRHNVGTVYDSLLNGVRLNGKLSWDIETSEPALFSLCGNPANVTAYVEKYIKTDEYVDLHHWVFTRTSFELLIYDLICLGFLQDLKIKEIFDTVRFTFFASLQKSDKQIESYDAQKRLRLLHKISEELRVYNMCTLKNSDFKIYQKNIQNSFIAKLRKIEKPIAIWGCGLIGRQLMNFMTENNVKFECFLDNSEKLQGTLIEGKHIYSPKDIINGKAYFIIVSSVRYSQEMVNTLTLSGLTDDVDFLVVDDMLRLVINTNVDTE